MKLKKVLVDKVITLTKKYYKEGKADVLPALKKAEGALIQNSKVSHQVIILIGDLAMFTHRNGKGTYEDIYEALAIFGVIVE